MLFFAHNIVMENFHSQEIENVYEFFKTNSSGLTSAESKIRLQENGKNSIENKKKKNLFLSFLKQFANVMIAILLVAGIISVVFAVLENSISEIVDACIIFAVVILNGLLGFIQELKADKSLEKLKKMTISKCKVFRDGKLVQINSEDLVLGDVVFFEAGDIIPADIRLTQAVHLKIEESSLTGESNAVEKNVDVLSENTPLADRKNMSYMGTSVSYGRGYGVVVATSLSTEMGKIATMLKTSTKQKTPIQKDLKTLGKFITAVVLCVSVVVFFLEFFRADQTLIESFMTSVAIAVAAIPESLPAVITIIMALGVNKLSSKNAIVKKLSSVETLGACEIICSDKTGTLTENKMTVTNVYDLNDIIDLNKDNVENISQSLDYMLKCMALCNTCAVNNENVLGDPTEVALVEFANKCSYNKEQLQNDFKLTDEYPFDSTRKLMSTVHSFNENKYIFTKGGLDEVLSCCSKAIVNNKVVELSDALKKKISKVASDFAHSSLRVLAFAVCENGMAEQNMTFIGIAGMIDPPRKEAFKAVADCKRAGMTPIMITGDHKDTAFEIAKRLGIAKDEKEVLTGAELDALSDEEYMKILKRIKVYARVSPENKVRIVSAYKSIKKIVAMTGDGVNDAPSIKRADIGIGMGITGTDISKQVADIIISDDNFASIIIAVEEGRKIFKNIEKTIKFLLSANIAETLSILLASIFFPQLVFLLPVQILFINLITDSLPAMALGVEGAEKNLMKEKPRDVKKNILKNGNGIQMLAYAIFQTAIIIGVYCFSIFVLGENLAGTMAFFTLCLVQLFFCFVVRIEGYTLFSNPFKNKWLLLTVLFSLILLILLAFTPIAMFFHLENIGIVNFLVCVGFSALIIPICDLFKLIQSKIRQRKAKRADLVVKQH